MNDSVFHFLVRLACEFGRCKAFSKTGAGNENIGNFRSPLLPVCLHLRDGFGNSLIESFYPFR